MEKKSNVEMCSFCSKAKNIFDKLTIFGLCTTAIGFGLYKVFEGARRYYFAKEITDNLKGTVEGTTQN